MRDTVYTVSVTGRCIEGKKYHVEMTKEDARKIQDARNNQVVTLNDGRTIEKTDGEWAVTHWEERGSITSDELDQSELLSEAQKVLDGKALKAHEDEDEE